MIKERIVISSIYGWEMLEKLIVNNFEWIEDTSQFNKDTMEKVMKVIFLLEFDVQYLEKLYDLQNDLPFSPERINVTHVTNVIHVTNLKQALNHGLLLKKVQRVIKFNQNDWLKPYVDMNTDLRKKSKTRF